MALPLELDPAFAEQLDLLIPDAQTRELVLTGIRQTIAEEPSAGIPLDDPPRELWYHFIPDAPAWGIEKLTVLYSFTTTAVHLHWIDRTRA